MNIFMWSGPRNLSTALLRSFENRNDTIVLDEPFYAYYLKETKKNHPMAKEIINKYETNINKIIELVTKKQKKGKIFYQKHMTHHMLKKTPIDWIKSGKNCFLIRDPKEVIQSYLKQNELKNSLDIGFPNQKKIFDLIKKMNNKPIVINAYDLSNNPKKILKILCKKLNISFSKKMLKWPLGQRETDGIWGKIWYQNVKLTSNFKRFNREKIDIPYKYQNIYAECAEIFTELNRHNILNEK